MELIFIDLAVLFFIHFVADFLFQTEWMAQNKSKSLFPLAVHCTVYGLFFIAFGWLFALVTTGLHFVVDFFTSKLTHYLWDKGEVRQFFIVIGLDQLIHTLSILLVYYWLFL